MGRGASGMRQERDGIRPLRSEYSGAQSTPRNPEPQEAPLQRTQSTPARPYHQQPYTPPSAATPPARDGARRIVPERPLVTTNYTPPPPPAPEPLRVSPSPAAKGMRKVVLRQDGTPVPDQRSQNQRYARTRANRGNEPPPPPATTPPPPSSPSGWQRTPPDPYANEPILELPPPQASTRPNTSLSNRPRDPMRQPNGPGARGNDVPPRATVGRPSADERHLSLVQPAPVETPLPEGVCPLCRGAGYLRIDVPFGHRSFGKAVPCECKERELEQKRREELWRLSSLDAFQDMIFENFNPKVPGTREAWEIARRYAENPEGWLLFSGQCGSGKTHLAAAIANIQFQQGTLVLFAVVPKLLDHLRGAFAPTSGTTYDAIFDKVCEAGMLVLDDLGAEHSTPWAQEKLFQIINHRYMYQLPTVITTNLDLINDLDDRVRSRLTDISTVRHVRLSATDYRPKNTPTRQPGRGRG